MLGGLHLQELGIDIAGAPQQKLTPEVAQQAALLITMGCGETCPYVPGQPMHIHDYREETLCSVWFARMQAMAYT
jgi:protein-tyrosine-phosphatase